VSARPGDRALITRGGRLEGWIGGSCTAPIVVREALAGLADGNARLLRVRPPGATREPDRPGVVTEVTTCASEGGVDVFIEPRIPRPVLAVVGSSPVARSLAAMAGLVGYDVTGVLDSPGEHLPGVDRTLDLDAFSTRRLRALDAVVVATMNRYDEAAVEAGLRCGAGYIGLVASKARARTVRDSLAGRGLTETDLDRVRAPAGLDLGPSTQEEIALAILAEVVGERHRVQAPGAEPLCPPDDPAEAVDPVCGMRVAAIEGAISLEHQREKIYFCSPGCRAAFAAAPDTFAGSGGG
jgi:xanthine dehydrogenase accessory factor